MNFNHLYHIHIIAEEGSLSAAATRLRLRSSTLSEQLKRFESYCGAQFFFRHPTGLQLTPEGQLLHRFTSIIFRAGDRLRLLFGKDRSGRPPVVEIGVTTELSELLGGEFFLPICTTNFAFVRIQRNTREVLLQKLADRILDLVVVEREITPSPSMPFITEELFPLHLRLVSAAKGKVRAVRFPSKSESLPFIYYSRDMSFHSAIEMYLVETGVRTKTVSEVEQISTALAAVRAGVCASLLPTSLVRSGLESRELRDLTGTPLVLPEVVAVGHERMKSEPLSGLISIMKRSGQWANAADDTQTENQLQYPKQDQEVWPVELS